MNVNRLNYFKLHTLALNFKKAVNFRFGVYTVKNTRLTTQQFNYLKRNLNQEKTACFSKEFKLIFNYVGDSFQGSRVIQIQEGHNVPSSTKYEYKYDNSKDINNKPETSKSSLFQFQNFTFFVAILLSGKMTFLIKIIKLHT